MSVKTVRACKGSRKGSLVLVTSCLSSSVLVNAVDDRDSVAALLGSHVFKGVTVEVKRGDYAPLMSAVVGHLTKAKVSCPSTHHCLFVWYGSQKCQ